jgi:2'-5' RNA ligase
MTSAGSVEADATLRLFLGLPLPETVRGAFAQWAARYCRPALRPDRLDPSALDSDRLDSDRLGGGIRLVRPEDLHVTLAFLGRRRLAEVPDIVAALRASARGAALLELTPLRWRETRSVGMVVLRDETGAAGRLAGDLHTRLEALGVYRRERRPWLAHVTVARWRQAPRLASLPAAQHVAALPPVGTFVPSEAAAYISRLHPSGARYEVLESVPLEPGPAAERKLDPPENPVGGVRS